MELNLDGLVGPTHHYGGLSKGNIASYEHAHQISNPKEAALEGLRKMRFLYDLGIPQGLMLPHERPNLRFLHWMGFHGDGKTNIEEAFRKAPHLLSAAFSQSGMWAANAATVSSAYDTHDGRVHFTPANLVTNLHRQQETFFTAYLLKTIFSDANYFMHHPPLPMALPTSDEGAANHNRLAKEHGESGLSIFVYGKDNISTTKRYPERQTLEASHAIARSHSLSHEKTFFVHQNPDAIDAGVFHNDVISVANEYVFLVHEEAFLEQAQFRKKLEQSADFDLQWIEISKEQLSLSHAVSSYFFNSQLVTLPDGKMMLIMPSECETPYIQRLTESLISDDNPIARTHFLPLRQSMKNGGGPACLRLRVPLSQEAFKAMDQRFLVTPELLDKLEAWVHQHYRNELKMDDLRDPHFTDEAYTALDKLTQIMNLPSCYSFQKETL